MSEPIQMSTCRSANEQDLAALLLIYNQGIEDGLAALEEETKNIAYMKHWFDEHTHHYPIVVAESETEVIGWADLHPYSHRCAESSIAELSIYVHRNHRHRGVGTLLLQTLEKEAQKHHFHKLVLATLVINKQSQGLYRKMGYREVGIFQKHGRLHGQWTDILWMEKLLAT